jgi:hypothetical protein
MFNLPTLAALLAVTIGYRPAYDGAPDEPAELPEELRAADGALAVQDVHPLLTLRNIRLSAPQMSEAAFFEYLATARATAATKVLSDFGQRKQLTGAGKRLLQATALTEASGAYRDKIIRQGRFVGLALRPRADKPDVAVRVTAVGTQFTQAEPGFKMYLYHSSDMSQPVRELPLPRLERVYFEWSPLVLELSGQSGGTWYLGYYESDMSGQAIRLDQNLQRAPGGQCCGNAQVLFEKWSPYVQVLPFSQDTPEGEFSYQSNTNWGLNLRLEAACDVTGLLSEQLPSFAGALRLQLAVDLLTMMANSTRDNGIESNVKAMTLLELNNRQGGQPGLLTQLSQAQAALDVDLTGLSGRCLGCDKNPGIRFSTI